MPRPRVLPPLGELVKLRDQGLTFQAIADKYGVTKGSVHQQFRDAGLTRRGKRYPELVPWKVSAEHSDELPVVMLRLLGRSQNEPLDDADQRRLDRWLALLRERDQVVAYDPAIGPNAAARNGGFAYVKRRHGVDKFPVSDPDKPRDLSAFMTPLTDVCAICGSDEHVVTLAVLVNDDGRRRTLRTPVCLDHMLVLVNAGYKRETGRERYRWANG